MIQRAVSPEMLQQLSFRPSPQPQPYRQSFAQPRLEQGAVRYSESPQFDAQQVAVSQGLVEQYTDASGAQKLRTKADMTYTPAQLGILKQAGFTFTQEQASQAAGEIKFDLTAAQQQAISQGLIRTQTVQTYIARPGETTVSEKSQLYSTTGRLTLTKSIDQYTTGELALLRQAGFNIPKQPEEMTVSKPLGSSIPIIGGVMSRVTSWMTQPGPARGLSAGGLSGATFGLWRPTYITKAETPWFYAGTVAGIAESSYGAGALLGITQRGIGTAIGETAGRVFAGGTAIGMGGYGVVSGYTKVQAMRALGVSPYNYILFGAEIGAGIAGGWLGYGATAPTRMAPTGTGRELTRIGVPEGATKLRAVGIGGEPDIMAAAFRESLGLGPEIPIPSEGEIMPWARMKYATTEVAGKLQDAQMATIQMNKAGEQVADAVYGAIYKVPKGRTTVFRDIMGELKEVMPESFEVTGPKPPARLFIPSFGEEALLPSVLGSTVAGLGAVGTTTMAKISSVARSVPVSQARVGVVVDTVQVPAQVTRQITNQVSETAQMLRSYWEVPLITLGRREGPRGGGSPLRGASSDVWRKRYFPIGIPSLGAILGAPSKTKPFRVSDLWGGARKPQRAKRGTRKVKRRGKR